MKLIVTGGAGFIGSNFVRYWLKHHPEDRVLNLDALTYAGNPANLADIADLPNYRFVQGDIADGPAMNALFGDFRPDVVVNFAAESHNSRAVVDPTLFFRTNVMGTQTLLEAARKHPVRRFHHISTCEVFGDLDLDSPEMFREDSPYRPNTPYNASKASADLVVHAYHRTFHLPVTISNCSNNYGPYQFPEKIIPLFITRLMDGRPMTLYRQSLNRREWLHVEDHCRAIELILEKGREGQMYNVGSGVEKSIEEIADLLLEALDKPRELKTYVEDRPGHDRRYLLDSTKIRKELGWAPTIDFDGGIRNTIRWYIENRPWWEALQKRNALDEGEWGDFKGSPSMEKGA